MRKLYSIAWIWFRKVDTSQSGYGNFREQSMKETTRRRITVTSSLNEMSTNQLIGRWWGGGGDVIPPAPTHFYRSLLEIFKDNVNVFPPPRIFASWTMQKLILPMKAKIIEGELVKQLSYEYIPNSFHYLPIVSLVFWKKKCLMSTYCEEYSISRGGKKLRYYWL
jgi:hypothetical protein